MAETSECEAGLGDVTSRAGAPQIKMCRRPGRLMKQQGFPWEVALCPNHEKLAKGEDDG